MAGLPLFLLASSFCFAQAGTPNTVGAWYELNEASDIHSGDLGCYSSSQVNLAYHKATITMIKNPGAFVCGGSDDTNYSSTQDYLSGSIIWHDLNFKPTSGNPITIEVKAELSPGWPAIWLIGGDKAASSGCQTTSPQSWDNFSTCNWPQDTMPNGDSAEIDIAEGIQSTSSITSVRENAFVNSSSGDTGNSSTISDATQNFHLYHLDWSTSQLCWAIDGTQMRCESAEVPQNPMFLDIENRIYPSAVYNGPFPVTMTIEYVQVCQGTTCTAPDSAGGNTLFLDDFNASNGPVPPANLTITNIQ